MRISRQQMYMDMAEIAAKRSTCFRGNVGALIIRVNTSGLHQVLATGYNGPGSGHPHCQGNSCQLTPLGGCARSLHAERNALEFAKLLLPSLEGCHLYCTASPCPQCAGLIIENGITRFFYRNPYRLTDGLEMLAGRGIEVYRVTPSGMIVRESDRRVMEEAELHA